MFKNEAVSKEQPFRIVYIPLRLMNLTNKSLFTKILKPYITLKIMRIMG
jgi:hypothetical protein